MVFKANDEPVLGGWEWSGVTRRSSVRLRGIVVASCGLLVAVLLLRLAVSPGQVAEVGNGHSVQVPAGLRAVVQRVVGSADRGFWVTHRGGLMVARGDRISSAFSRLGVRVMVPGGVVGMRLVGAGYGAASTRVLSSVEPVASHNVVRYRRPGLVESYRNGPLGLEQGFTLTRRPSGRASGPLELALALRGTLTARSSGGGIEFVSRSGVVALRYGELRVVDASGRRLRSALSLSGGQLLLRVWDRGAPYPLLIDPLIEPGVKLVGDCTGSCSGPNGTGETGATESGTGQFGISVALSDDGSTALVGAPGDGNIQGAAWVFTRSGSVWSQQGAKLVGDCAQLMLRPERDRRERTRRLRRRRRAVG